MYQWELTEECDCFHLVLHRFLCYYSLYYTRIVADIFLVSTLPTLLFEKCHFAQFFLNNSGSSVSVGPGLEVDGSRFKSQCRQNMEGVLLEGEVREHLQSTPRYP